MELISREEVNRLLHNQREMKSRVNQLRTYEGIEWHPYPKEKPKESKLCLVSIGELALVCQSFYMAGYDMWDHFSRDSVLAWAEMPKGYKPKKEGEEDGAQTDQATHSQEMP